MENSDDQSQVAQINCLVDQHCETRDELLAQGKEVAPSISRDIRIKVFNEWIERFKHILQEIETMSAQNQFYSELEKAIPIA
jgi:hypothetical protein